MKFREEFAFLICSLAVVLVTVEAQGRQRVQSNEYNEEYSDYGSPDYGQPAPPVDHRVACYACSYEEESPEEFQGMVNCNEPFKNVQVPEVMCNGSCSMSFIWREKPAHFLIVRDCRPKCKEKVSEHGYTKCCTTKLCNGFTSSIEQVKFNVCLTLLLAFIVLADVAKVFS